MAVLPRLSPVFATTILVLLAIGFVDHSPASGSVTPRASSSHVSAETSRDCEVLQAQQTEQDLNPIQNPVDAQQDGGSNNDNPFADFETHFLSNGLKLWYKRLPNEPDMFVGAIIPYGRDSDERGKEQTAHFVEHMLFSDHLGRTEEEIKREIEDRGGNRNGFTSADWTYYYASIGKEHGFFAMDWIYRVVSPHEMDPEVVERQRQPVALEIGAQPREFFDYIRDYVINPPWLRVKGFWEVEFGMGDRLYRWYDPHTSLNSIGPEDLRHHYDTYYVPSRMTLVVVGDMERDSTIALAEATFGTLPARPAPQITTELTDPNRYRQSVLWSFRPDILYDTRFKVFDLTPEKHLRLIFVQDLLQFRLNQKLRFSEQKAVYGVSVNLATRGPATFLRITARIDEEQYDFANSVIEEELEFIRNGNIPPDEFEQLRELLVTRLIRGNREPIALGTLAARRFFNPDLHRDYPDLAGFYETATQADLAVFAGNLFVQERRAHNLMRRHPMSQGLFFLLTIGIIALTVQVARRLLIRRIDMPGIRYVARFRRHLLVQVAGVAILGLMMAVLYRLAYQGVYLFYATAVAPIDSFIIQISFFWLGVMGGVSGIIACLAILPHKLLVFDDHLLIKYRAYRSKRIPISEVEAISTHRLGGFLRNGGAFRFTPLTLALFKPGVLLQTTSGRGYFFRVRDVEELIVTINELQIIPDNPTEAG